MPARIFRSCRCDPSGWSRSDMTTWRAPGSGTQRSSSGGGPTASPNRAVSLSWKSRSASTWPTSWRADVFGSSARLGAIIRSAAALAAVTALATACVHLGAQSPPTAAPQHGTNPDNRKSDNPKSDNRKSGDPPGVGVSRSYRVRSRWVTFYEPAYTVDGSVIASRRLLTQVRYPLAGRSSTTQRARGPFPMIVYAPGFMQCGAPYSKLLTFWATAGYVVVVVNFPNSDCLVGNPTEDDMLNQPRDVSYVITRMLRLSRARHGPFARLLNRRQIAIAGQSDG